MTLPSIPDEVVIAAIETALKPLGTSLKHYMPASKVAAIEAMRGILLAEREHSAAYHDAWVEKHRRLAIDRPDDSEFHLEHVLRHRVHAAAIRKGEPV